jgi:hypothetical protein
MVLPVRSASSMSVFFNRCCYNFVKMAKRSRVTERLTKPGRSLAFDIRIWSKRGFPRAVARGISWCHVRECISTQAPGLTQFTRGAKDDKHSCTPRESINPPASIRSKQPASKAGRSPEHMPVESTRTSNCVK